MTQRYQEPYRNTFHFSPAEGWMNDVNGVWYADGLYHLTYQAYPYATRWDTMHWGYAVSHDLLHWTQMPVALEPGRNTVGPAFSGTAVVDVHNTAGFGAGAYILIYTDIVRGQCIAYSTDGGKSFCDYANNPIVLLPELAALEDKCAQRDPKVFWDEASGRWYMVVFYENLGTHSRQAQFFSSQNLLQWERLPDFIRDDFYECPDMYRLPLDGDPDKAYWVLQDAASLYHIGTFDGERFVPVESPGERLDYGPDFYAGQVFFGAPGDRTLALYWMNGWNGTTVPTTPWVNGTSVPCELKLVTTPEGIRVTRYPVEELNTLWKNFRRWEDTVSATNDPLADIQADAYDLQLDLAVADSAATTLYLSLRGRQFRLSLAEETLSTRYTRPDKNQQYPITVACPGIARQLSLRVLGDRDSVEIFVNGGRYNYTEEHGFNPYNNTLSLLADAPMVCTIRYAEMANCWAEPMKEE